MSPPDRSFDSNISLRRMNFAFASIKTTQKGILRFVELHDEVPVQSRRTGDLMRGQSANANSAFSRCQFRPAQLGIVARLTVIPCLVASVILAGCGNNSNRSGDSFP